MSPYFVRVSPGMSVNVAHIAWVQDEGNNHLVVGLCTPGPGGSQVIRVDDAVAVAALRHHVMNHTKPAHLADLIEQEALPPSAPSGGAWADGGSKAS